MTTKTKRILAVCGATFAVGVSAGLPCVFASANAAVDETDLQYVLVSPFKDFECRATTDYGEVCLYDFNDTYINEADMHNVETETHYDDIVSVYNRSTLGETSVVMQVWNYDFASFEYGCQDTYLYVKHNDYVSDNYPIIATDVQTVHNFEVRVLLPSSQWVWNSPTYADYTFSILSQWRARDYVWAISTNDIYEAIMRQNANAVLNLNGNKVINIVYMNASVVQSNSGGWLPPSILDIGATVAFLPSTDTIQYDGLSWGTYHDYVEVWDDYYMLYTNDQTIDEGATSIWNIVGDFLDTEFLPNFTFGNVLLVAFGCGAFMLILKIAFGG